jgi:hypothetical protein
MLLALASATAFHGSLPANAEPIVQIASRGQSIRAVLLVPAGRPKGSVILFAGGNGRLDITNEGGGQGSITKLTGNQLVRTRAQYQAKRYITLVPDLAPDMKVGASDVQPGYRASADFAADVGAMVAYLRTLSRKPVTAIGTSRGSISVANAIAKLNRRKQPHAAVYTSAFLKLDCTDLNIWCIANGDAGLLDVPSLVVWHREDACASTPPSAVKPFRNWWQGGTGDVLALKSFTGGLPPESAECDAKSPHGFWGLDDQVVQAITKWIATH